MTHKIKDESLPAEDEDYGLGHRVSVRICRYVLCLLLFLTVITVLVSRINLGALNIFAAMLIASVKAALVGAFFMHLKFEKKLVIGFALYPILILALLIGGTLGDVATREPVAGGTVIDGNAAGTGLK